MLYFMFGLFVMLHGLVHLWFVTLSQRLVAFERAMGWSGQSWIFTPLLGDATTRLLASGLYTLVTLAFVLSSVGIFIRADWWRTVLMASALCSSAIILLFWDGRLEQVALKGLLGLLVNVAIVVTLLRVKEVATSS